MATRIQVRRGDASEWTSVDPVLSEGELGYETDTGKFKIGDGSSLWSALDYFLDSSDLSEYLTASSASTIYLTQASASENYLAQVSASSTYLTQSSASATYVLKNDPEFSFTQIDQFYESPAIGTDGNGFSSLNGYANGYIIFNSIAPGYLSVGDVFYVTGSDGIDNIRFTVIATTTNTVDGLDLFTAEVNSNLSNLSALQTWAPGYNVKTNGSSFFNSVGEGYLESTPVINKSELAKLENVSENIQDQLDRSFLISGVFPTALTSSGAVTLTSEQLLSKVLTWSNNSANATLTLPTGTALGTSVLDGMMRTASAFSWTLVNVNPDFSITNIFGSTGHSYFGKILIPFNTSASFITVKTSSNTFQTYRTTD
jgi:hypothetical protein